MNTSMPSFDDFSNGSVNEFDASASSSSPRSPIPNSSEVNIVLASENPKKRAGRKIFQETRHPVYRGVRRRNKDKWVSEMRVPNDNKSRIWLGTYTTPEMAARAHDVASLTFRGKSACLNFADSAWRVTLPESTDPVDIRKAAMEAAIMLSGDENNQPMEAVAAMEEAAPAVSSDWRMGMSFSDEPIMSPSPSETDLSNWYDVEISDLDAPVSLWNY